MAIKALHEESGYPVATMCQCLDVSRSGYYKWIKKPEKNGPNKDDWLSDKIIEYYTKFKGIYGVRRIQQEIEVIDKRHYDVKTIRRLMRRLGLQSVIRRKRNNYIYTKPEVTAENILNRDFTAEKPNQKWLTDVTEFKYGRGQKAYLSGILDLGDNSIVSYVLGHNNNNNLVFRTFNLAVNSNPKAKPIFHSDRGFQYTSAAFRKMLDETGCTQSMSRVGCCLDNAPMEGFWGTLKSEMYYLDKFDTYSNLELAVEEYIYFYNNERFQKKYKGLAPLQMRSQTLAA